MPPKVATAAVQAGESTTRRQQGKKTASSAHAATADKSSADREIVKAVLASPLTVPWPNLPRHLQNAVMHTLPQVVPPDVSAYHLSRARCHKQAQRAKRKASRKDKGDETTRVDGAEVHASEETTSTGPALIPATRPAILDHLVLGLNETIKSLERSIDTLKLRILILSDTLASTQPHQVAGGSGQSTTLPRFLPTAVQPNTAQPPPSAPTEPRPAIPQDAPLTYVLIPLSSVNPTTLLAPIPQYCATFNTLAYQHAQLLKVARTRVSAAQLGDIGEDMEEVEEVRIVPLGKVEAELAEKVGLRRITCLGLRSSHPALPILLKLLPKSTLHPPRHSFALPPIPTAALVVHTTLPQPQQQLPPSTTTNSTNLAPAAGIHYAPLLIKGIKTTVPADGHARKRKRLEEVREKRRAKKEEKRTARSGLAKEMGPGILQKKKKDKRGKRPAEKVWVGREGVEGENRGKRRKVGKGRKGGEAAEEVHEDEEMMMMNGGAS